MTVRLHIRAVAASETLSRIIGLLAQRALVPDMLAAHRHDADLHIELDLAIDTDRALLIAAKLREQILVDSVIVAPARAAVAG